METFRYKGMDVEKLDEYSKLIWRLYRLLFLSKEHVDYFFTQMDESRKIHWLVI